MTQISNSEVIAYRPGPTVGLLVGRLARLVGYCFDKLSAQPFLGHELVRQLSFLLL